MLSSLTQASQVLHSSDNESSLAEIVGFKSEIMRLVVRFRSDDREISFTKFDSMSNLSASQPPAIDDQTPTHPAFVTKVVVRLMIPPSSCWWPGLFDLIFQPDNVISERYR
nr:hypothetical protein CFP56_11797 [Quercus suber]